MRRVQNAGRGAGIERHKRRDARPLNLRLFVLRERDADDGDLVLRLAFRKLPDFAHDSLKRLERHRHVRVWLCPEFDLGVLVPLIEGLACRSESTRLNSSHCDLSRMPSSA